MNSGKSVVAFLDYPDNDYRKGAFIDKLTFFIKCCEIL